VAKWLRKTHNFSRHLFIHYKKIVAKRKRLALMPWKKYCVDGSTAQVPITVKSYAEVTPENQSIWIN
jgi:hypothetical protein